MADSRSGLVVETGHGRASHVVVVAIGSRRDMLQMRVMVLIRSVGKWCRHRGHKWSCRWVEAVMRRRFRFPMVAMVQREWTLVLVRVDTRVFGKAISGGMEPGFAAGSVLIVRWEGMSSGHL